jgi:hypothetical protein
VLYAICLSLHDTHTWSGTAKAWCPSEQTVGELRSYDVRASSLASITPFNQLDFPIFSITYNTYPTAQLYHKQPLSKMDQIMNFAEKQLKERSTFPSLSLPSSLSPNLLVLWIKADLHYLLLSG